MTTGDALRLFRATGASGLVIGAACLLAPAAVSKAAGLPAERRAHWALRLFGVRDVVLGVALLAVPPEPAATVRVLALMVAATQFGDLLVTAGMLARHRVSARASAGVAAGAPATIAAMLAVRTALRDS